MSRRDAVIIGAVRSPIGRRNGSLTGTHAVELSGLVLNALSERAQVSPAHVDDVIWGCVSQVGEQMGNVGRYAVLQADWPTAVPATTVDRQCGSSQQAIHFAAAGVISGQYDVAVAGGVEMMSRVPMGSSRGVDVGHPMTARIKERFGVEVFHQGMAAEAIAAQWGLDRAALDELSAQSHQRATQAARGGNFDAELVPVPLVDGGVLSADETPRPDSTPESLGFLKPAFSEGGIITAGSSSQISDGAAAVMITTSEKAAELGATPLARIHTAVVVGDDPVMMLTGPIPATELALKRSGLSIADIDTFEVNEAFAPIPLAWMAETGASSEATNPDGAAIALGHPLGSSGARLMTTMVHRLHRLGLRYGLQTMCEGGGMANATIIECL